MRRLLAILLAALFAWMQAAPALAFSSQTNLPVCCRRDGRHHCVASMSGASGSRSVAAIAPRCPAFPKAVVAPTPASFAPTPANKIGAPLFVHPAAQPQTEARYRISFARSRQKRGPPVFAL